MPIHAIVFDLDGTLRTNRPTFNQAFFDFIARLEIPPDREAERRMMRWQHYYWAQSPELSHDRASFDGDEEHFWINHTHRNLVAYGLTADHAGRLAPKIQQMYAREFDPEDILYPEATPTLHRLRSQGFRLALLSNRSESCQTYLDQNGLAGFFEFSVTAGELNSWKPGSEIFNHTCRRLGCAPAHTFYVGDNYYADIIGARRAGWQPILVDPEGVFPDADCPVILNLAELPELLRRYEDQ